MGANIITGYTGTRHITPAMDAAVYRSVFGAENYILADGNQLAGSMPSVNSFTILDGVVSMQGHQVQVTQETLSVDTCANGYVRIDLVAVRFEHDNSTLIDSASLVVIKGTEVQSGNTPPVPSYNTGNIDAGASVVDFPIYQINLSGGSVTFSSLASVIQAVGGVMSAPSLSSSELSAYQNRVTIQAGGQIKMGKWRFVQIRVKTEVQLTMHEYYNVVSGLDVPAGNYAALSASINGQSGAGAVDAYVNTAGAISLQICNTTIPIGWNIVINGWYIAN